jgi:hypothetical protein
MAVNKNKQQKRNEKKWKAIQLRNNWCLYHKDNFGCELFATKDNLCLFHFHHALKEDGHRNKEDEISWDWGFERIVKELNKGYFLCANCHALIHKDGEPIINPDGSVIWHTEGPMQYGAKTLSSEEIKKK